MKMHQGRLPEQRRRRRRPVHSYMYYNFPECAFRMSCVRVPVPRPVSLTCVCVCWRRRRALSYMQVERVVVGMFTQRQVWFII